MSDELLVLVPSRGRPENIDRLVDGWHTTAATAQLAIVLDDDDPALPDYMERLDEAFKESPFLEVRVGERIRLGPTLNREAFRSCREYPYMGFMGDDHLPVTVQWDERIRDHLDNLGTGIVYGNDLLQGANLPTAVFLTSDVVKTLGYMCPPHLVHMYLDNAWKDWGTSMSRLRYLPDVIIEHLHPVAGKAPGDEGYAEVNAFMDPDQLAYGEYRDTGEFTIDCAKLYALANG